jgi:hypothetical protein
MPHFLADTPDQDDWLEWIALMQHYGAPTRFLDWTYSLYVAVFFAVERSDRVCLLIASSVDQSLLLARRLLSW